MRIRPFVYALVALAAALPATALAGTAVKATVTPTADVVAGSTVQITCWAEGSPSMGSAVNVVEIAVTVSAGTASPTLLTGAVNAPCSFDATMTCSVLEGTSAWATPPEPGTLTATCTGKFQGVFGGPTYASASASLTTIEGVALPPVIAGVNGPAELVVGATAVYEAVATDPNDPPQPLTYAWSATGGIVTQDASNPALAAWEAPTSPGPHKLTVAVSNGAGTSTGEKGVNVVLAAYQASLPLPLGAPRRLAASGTDGIFVVDGTLQGTTSGTVALVTARGEARGFATLPEPALAVATGAGVLWTTTTKGSLYKIDPVTGRALGKVALAGGPLGKPSGIAYDSATMTLWIAEMDTNRVRVVTPDGATVAVLAEAGGVRLTRPVDVAVDAATGKAWVLVLQAQDPSATTAAGMLLHAFDLATRAYLGSYVSSGGGLGQVTTGGGIVVGATRVYVSDVYQGVVQVLSPTGAPVATIGSWGNAVGQLTNPMGLAVMANGDVAVANTTLGKIERFGGGAPLPTCTGDQDCDLLPDTWETANGLDPAWAGDGLLNLDGDGLNNAEELAAGTSPNSADTDGDGWSDSDELASGFDPNNPDDHRAIVEASGPADTGPGLVKLRATATGAEPCTVAWAQRTGPAVALAGADTTAPSFIARAAGSYAFDAVATCGTAQSLPSRATVVVNNVAPLADAGGVLVAAPGSPIRLDALASSDANGDALSFTWDQTLGRPIVGSSAGATLSVRPRGAGLYAFQVTVQDGGGNATTAEVPVLVTEGQAPTAIAAALPAAAEVGATVVLDASTSLVHEGSTFAWRQLSGPAATLAGASEPVASFVPQAAGRHAFEVVAGTGSLRTPPARVEVFVSEPGVALPTVSASAPSIVAVGVPVALEATPSPSAATVTWRQISGPAAGLTEADRASATVVPFAAGFHVFEASVKDGAAEGHPTRVAFEARAGGAELPQARVATPPGDAWVGQLVFLDGRASTGAARFRWTQVAGPWVAFGTQGAVATLRPLAVGLYAFELVVDDGVTRSAPARVEVNVVPPEVQ
jgi:hypothetical protein